MTEDKKYFDFKDVNLVPRKGMVKSRSECNTEISMGKHTFKLPVIPANMESIMNVDIATKLASEGYFYIMHRFMTNDEQIEFVRTMKSKGLISSISIGVNKESYELIDMLIELGLDPDYITVDIAHGHSKVMEKMLGFLKYQVDSFIIAGNICTVEAANDLSSWGADAVKIGIAPGHVCTTAMATGFGSRGIQASLIKHISDNMEVEPFIIADGGIREHGHIPIAITMGADMVMVGSMMAGFKDSPGNLIRSNEDDKFYKEYWGSASQYQSGKTNRIEGTKTLIPYKNRDLLDEYKSITESLQSAISYAGGCNLKSFQFTKYIITK
jgi:GMP reductase